MIGSGNPIIQPSNAYLILPLRWPNCLNMRDFLHKR